MVMRHRHSSGSVKEVNHRMRATPSGRSAPWIAKQTPSFQSCCTQPKLEALYSEQNVTGEEARTAFLRTSSEAAFLHGKVCTSRFFTHHILSKNTSLAQMVRSHDTSAYDILFEDERELELPY